ncbi:hypothetical protein Plhal703r1_c41g0140681 [Plasmopara halstedii]
MFSLTVRGTYPLQPLFGLQGAAERYVPCYKQYNNDAIAYSH